MRCAIDSFSWHTNTTMSNTRSYIMHRHQLIFFFHWCLRLITHLFFSHRSTSIDTPVFVSPSYVHGRYIRTQLPRVIHQQSDWRSGAMGPRIPVSPKRCCSSPKQQWRAVLWFSDFYIFALGLRRNPFMHFSEIYPRVNEWYTVIFKLPKIALWV